MRILAVACALALAAPAVALAGEKVTPELVIDATDAGGVYSVAWSPDGATLATGNRDGTVRLFGADGAPLAQRVVDAPRPQRYGMWGSSRRPAIFAVAFAGEALAFGSTHFSAGLVDARTLAPRPAPEGAGGGIGTDLAVSADGKLLAALSPYPSHEVVLWDSATGRKLRELPVGDEVESVAFSPEGRLLAAGSDEGEIGVFVVATGERDDTLEGHTSAVFALAFSPDGKTLASGAGNPDDTVRLWDVERGISVREIRTDQVVWSVLFAPDGRHVLAGGGGGRIQVYDASTGATVHDIHAHRHTVASLAISPDGRRLASAGGDGAVMIWDLAALGLASAGAPRSSRAAPAARAPRTPAQADVPGAGHAPAPAADPVTLAVMRTRAIFEGAEPGVEPRLLVRVENLRFADGRYWRSVEADASEHPSHPGFDRAAASNRPASFLRPDWRALAAVLGGREHVVFQPDEAPVLARFLEELAGQKVEVGPAFCLAELWASIRDGRVARVGIAGLQGLRLEWRIEYGEARK